MGADSLDYFEKWVHPEIICKKANVLVAVRDDMDFAQVNAKIAYIKKLFPAEISTLKGGRTEVSSTEIRERLLKNAKTGFDVQDALLAKPVWNYILEHGLYGSTHHGDK